MQKEIQRDPRDELADYRMEDISIRGDTIMWFYTDGDGESRKCLIVAKLDDPDSTATKHFDLGWDAVGYCHAYSQRRRCSSCDAMFPVDTRSVAF